MRDSHVIDAEPDSGQDGHRRSKRSRASFVVLGLAAALVMVVTISANVASADPSANDWLRLRQCESGNNYSINTGNGYYGAYQFDAATWKSVGGTGLPHQASPATQDALALKLWQQRGWAPWVCATILGLGGSSSTPLPPKGAFDTIKANGRTAVVTGWADDPNSSSSSIQVHVYVDSRGYAFTANKPRPDVNAALSITGQHGFTETVDLQPGPNKVCAFAIGQAENNNTLLDCKTVQGLAPPTGVVDTMAVNGWDLTVTGWAVDPNNSGTSIPVHIYFNGSGTAYTANKSRDDVNRALGIVGQHGFSETMRLKRGPNSVCVFAIGLADNNNTLMSCRTINGPVEPMGTVDGMDVSGLQARVYGWAFDPNNPSASIPVHMYVNGGGTPYLADQPRDDVNRVFGVTGQHGFSQMVQLKPGSNSICVFGIGQAESNNILISCRDVQAGQAAQAAQQRLSVLGASPDPAAGESGSTTPAAESSSPQAVASPAPSTASATAESTTGSTTAPSTTPATTVIPAPGSTTATTGSTAQSSVSTPVSVPPLAGPFTSSPPSTVATTPTAPAAAKGALDSLTASGSGWSLSGWIADPAAGPIGTRVRITINGVTHDVLADKARDDVARSTGSPVPFGFVDQLDLTQGANEICLYEVDRDNTIVTAPIACRTETIP